MRLQPLTVLLLLCLVKHAVNAERVIQKGMEMMKGPSEEKIWNSGLLDKDVSAVSLYEKGMTYYEDTSIRKLQGSTLAFVGREPESYERAIRFKNKLTHVAPPWFTLRRHKDPEKRKDFGGYHLDGEENLNMTWMTLMRSYDENGETSPYPKIVPHVKLGLDVVDMVNLLQNPKDACISIFLHLLHYNLDGVVLDAHTQWLLMNMKADSSFWEATTEMIEGLAKLLHNPTPVLAKSPANDRMLNGQRNLKKELFVVIPPVMPQGPNLPPMPVKVVKAVSNLVDGISMALYDFSKDTPGPSQPMDWVDLNLQTVLAESNGGLSVEQAKKLSIGIPFHGRDFQVDNNVNEDIRVEEFLKVIGKYQPQFKWDDKHKEHYFLYKDPKGRKHRVYFPTPRFVQSRLDAFAKQYGVTLSELSDGLERFFDLL